MPDVTVVVIGYNDVTNLATAVGSVLDQTLRNLEIIIVDDASTDGSAELADRLAAEHDRVQVVHLPENSGGCSRPRNTGLEHARATYVMFLDSDDVYERHACKNLLLEAERTGADVVAGQCMRRFLDRGGERKWVPYLYAERATYAGIRARPELFFDPLVTNKIYRRQFLADADIRFPEGVHYEDSLFSTKVYCQAGLIAVIPNVVYYWNVVKDGKDKSITQRRFEFDNFRDRIVVHRMIDDYLVGQGVADLKVHKDFKFVRHDLRLYLNALNARDDDYQRRFVELAGDYLATVSDETLAMVDPVERICVAMLRRQDIEETLTAVDYLWHGYKLSTELVERDGRIYWSAKYLEDREDRELMDVTDLGLHRIAFHDQVLFNEVTAADVSGGRLHLEGRLLNQLGRIAPGDNVSLTITVRNKGQAHERTFPATVLGNDGSHLRWRVDIDLLRATRPLDQRLRVWDVRAGVSWNGVSNVGELTLAPTTLLPALISMRAGMRGVVRGGSLRPIVTSKGSLSFEQAPDRGAAARIGAVHALLQRANRSLRRRAGAAISHPGAKRRAYRLFQRLPVKPGLTVFESHLGKQYSDNPKYIYEATRRVGLDRLGIDPVWSYATVATGFPPEAGRVLRNSWRYYYLLARAQYWVDNQGFPRVFTKRPETTYLQTWHGTPLKRMGWDGPLATLSTAKQRAQERMVARWDHLVVPSEYFVDTFVRAFRYDGKLLRTGYPRNDLLVNRAADGDYVTDAKRRMGLPLDRTIVLYAPTFRDRERGRDVTLPFDVSQLSVALHDDVFLLVRTHYLDRFTLGAGQAPFARSVSDYDDVTEVLLVADVLVTDYSSIMFDFANTGRPMVFYTHDYDDYVHRQRGTYFTLADEAPGPLVTTTEELARCLADIDAVRHVYADRYATWRQRFCEYDRGHAADDVVAQVFGSGDHV